MEYDELDYLSLSGILHFTFCRRRWALIYIDGQWEENLRTAQGRLMHENAHNPYISESRGSHFVSRAMPIVSRALGISGECDVVEFHKDSNGVVLHGKKGKYIPYPVEYKRGRPESSGANLLQLTAQAMCLEEMLCCSISEGAVYYGEVRHREKVIFDHALRQRTIDTVAEMHACCDNKFLPKATAGKGCFACSMKELCMPQILCKASASVYNQKHLGGEDEEIT